MKHETRSYYELMVRRAVERISSSLDEALDLAALGRAAALSPLHFHRIFRGMVGETPLELHRRLRLERAAQRLASSDAAVTAIAFDAGYETHESFTRAYRASFAISPSEFRQRAAEARRTGARPQPCELAAPSGIHFGAAALPSSSAALGPYGFAALTTTEPRSFAQGEFAMDVQIETLPELRVAAVSHRGPYNTIYLACARLGELARPAGLDRPVSTMLAIYHDDPETTPAAELRSEAALVVAADAKLPPGLTELRLHAGTYARAIHVGPYTLLGDAWARFMGQWLPQSGHRVGGITYEVYRNTPDTAAPHELRTDLYLALAP